MALLSAGAVVVANAVPAQAKDETRTSKSDAVAEIVVKKATPSSELSAQAVCEVPFYGHVGHALCGTDYFAISFTDGYVRAFVIGTDHAVWNIVRAPNGSVSGWRSLGGWLQVGVWLNFALGSFNMGIYSIGRDGYFWCRNLVNGWGAWHQC
jgi:hypothetical protein